MKNKSQSPDSQQSANMELAAAYDDTIVRMDARRYLQEQSGKMLDPTIVEFFLKLMER